MITLLIAEDEKKVKEILGEMLHNEGRLHLDITKQENIFRIIKKDAPDKEMTLRDRIIELEDTLNKDKDGVLYKSFLEVIEKPLFERILERTEGNQLKAARILGINRNTMRVKIKKLGINTSVFKL